VLGAAVAGALLLLALAGVKSWQDLAAAAGGSSGGRTITTSPGRTMPSSSRARRSRVEGSLFRRSILPWS